MATLLHVEASSRGEHSDSVKIVTIFLEVYREHHPDTAAVPPTRLPPGRRPRKWSTT
ncbi:MAG: hypothetical protein QOD88_1098 [Mycobacterium sp.]|jgi:FMN-dependent NADH-azoreductase|nr:hypothetical protein [Mycobacterium sp.]